MEKDVILAALSCDIALAGLLLVFSGFLITKADSFSGRYGDKFGSLAVAGFGLTVLALIAAFVSILGLQGNQWGAYYSLGCLKIVIAITAVYAIIAAIAFFP